MSTLPTAWSVGKSAILAARKPAPPVKRRELTQPPHFGRVTQRDQLHADDAQAIRTDREAVHALRSSQLLAQRRARRAGP